MYYNINILLPISTQRVLIMKHNSNMKISQMKKVTNTRENIEYSEFFHLLKFLSMNQHTNLHSAKNPINSATLLAIYAEIAIEGRGIVRQKHGIDAILFVAVLHFPPSVLLTRCNNLTTHTNQFFHLDCQSIISSIWIANLSFLSSEVPIYHFYYLDCQSIISII